METEKVISINDEINNMGLVLSASKIWNKLRLMRNADEQQKRLHARRWIWELLQNAKDSTDSRVDAFVDFRNGKLLQFSHNGNHFTSKGLLSLIMQTSFKEITREDDTGKFGTGFITTHLLSNVVNIRGVFQDYLGVSKSFDIFLDRSGETREDIEMSTRDAVELIKRIDMEEKDLHRFDNSSFNTNFIYELSEETVDVGVMGINDLNASVMFVLAFVPKLKSISVENKKESFKLASKEVFDIFYLFKVEKCLKKDKEIIENEIIEVMVLEKENTSISITITKSLSQISFQPLDILTPKLFCEFPLIGTELFPFPLVINCKDFEVTEPRDGILIGNINNQQILLNAVILHNELLHKASKHKYKNLHLLCAINSSNDEWININIVKPIKNNCITAAIVDVNNLNGELEAFMNNNNEQNLILPYDSSEELQDELWEICNMVTLKYKIPIKADLSNWTAVITEDKFKLTIRRLADIVIDLKNIDNLKSIIKDKVSPYTWLIRFYNLLLKNRKWYEYCNLCIVPNQNGEFKSFSELKIDDQIDETLKGILVDFKNDIKIELADKNIVFNIPQMNKVGNQEVAKRIKDEVYNQLKREANESKLVRDENIKTNFENLLIWFEKFPDVAPILFDELYTNKYKLFYIPELIKNIQLTQDVKKLMHDLNLSEVADLRKAIEENYNLDNPLCHTSCRTSQ